MPLPGSQRPIADNRPQPPARRRCGGGNPCSQHCNTLLLTQFTALQATSSPWAARRRQRRWRQRRRPGGCVSWPWQLPRAPRAPHCPPPPITSTLYSTFVSRTWPLSHTLSHTALYRQSSWVTGRRLGLRTQGRASQCHKGPPAHAHTIYFIRCPTTVQRSARGQWFRLAGRSPVGFGVTRQIPPQFPPPPFPPCIIYRACRRVAIDSAPAMLHSYRGCLCRVARAVVTSSRNRLCPAHIDELGV